MGRLLGSLCIWLVGIVALAPAADPPRPVAVLAPAGPPPDPPPEPEWVGFSPDGRTLLARYKAQHFRGREAGDELVAWSVDGWAERRRWSTPAASAGFRDQPNSCAILADGRVAAVTTDGLVMAGPAAGAPARVRLPDGGQDLAPGRLPSRHVWPDAGGTTVHLLTAGDSRFRLERSDLTGRAAGPEPLVGAVEGEQAIRSAALHPAGRWLAVGTDGWGGRVELWDVPGRKRVARLAGHEGEVSALAFVPDGKTLASGGAEGTVRLWDVAAGRERAVLTGPLFTVVGLAFAADGRRLVFATTDKPGTPNLWVAEPVAGKLVGRLATGGGVRRLALSPDGRLAAVAGIGPEVRVWDLAAAAGD